jgi:hypothetical protein
MTDLFDAAAPSPPVAGASPPRPGAPDVTSAALQAFLPHSS